MSGAMAFCVFHCKARAVSLLVGTHTGYAPCGRNRVCRLHRDRILKRDT